MTAYEGWPATVTCRALIGSYSFQCGAEPSHRVVLNNLTGAICSFLENGRLSPGLLRFVRCWQKCAAVPLVFLSSCGQYKSFGLFFPNVTHHLWEDSPLSRFSTRPGFHDNKVENHAEIHLSCLTSYGVSTHSNVDGGVSVHLPDFSWLAAGNWPWDGNPWVLKTAA